MEMMRIPIAVMSFNRPQFLLQTLESLRAQEGYDPDRLDIHLFQDAAVNKWSRMRYAEQADIDASIAVFRRLFPGGQVHYAGANIGICENFCRAESFMFEERRAESAWFFEDDMVLSPAYFTMMEKLERFAQRNPRAAYYAAYGNYYASAGEVATNREAIIPLDHHWAFGIRRDAWTKLQPALEGYYALVRGQDYARRYHREIFDYFARSGMVPRGSSQDAAKTWACARLGLVRLRTFAPFARYIGTEGAHMTPERFEQLGFEKTVMQTTPIETLAFPDANTLKEAVDEQRQVLTEIFKVEFDAIKSNLPARKYNPMRTSTEQDVINAYRLLLNREPESNDVFEKHVQHTSVAALVKGIRHSTEFMGQTENGTSNMTKLDARRLMDENDIRYAYRLILHREPDSDAAAGLYSGKIEVRDCIQNMIGSGEFRKLEQQISQY